MARNIFSRQVWKLTTERGYPMEVAKRIAYKQQLANGNIQMGTYQLTDQGKEYSNLFSEKRAVVRKNRAKQRRINNKQNALNNVL